MMKCKVVVRSIVKVDWQSIVLLVEGELQVTLGTTGANVTCPALKLHIPPLFPVVCIHLSHVRGDVVPYRYPVSCGKRDTRLLHKSLDARRVLEW